MSQLKCPKCGAGQEYPHDYIDGEYCLRRQLATVTAERDAAVALILALRALIASILGDMEQTRDAAKSALAAFEKAQAEQGGQAI